MSSDLYTRENVIAVTFTQDANAYEALSRLKELDSGGHVRVTGAAVVVRGDDGGIVEKDQIGEESWDATAGGGVIGLLVGILGGPVGVLVGGASGVLIGTMLDQDDDDETESVLSEIAKSVRVGATSLLADVNEESTEIIDAAMARLGGDVLRRPVADVEAEIAAAEDAQREARKKARKELHDARHNKHKQEIDAKLAELKSKLPGHKPAHTAGSAS
jgi:uncharacterized membrane protein